MASGGFTTMYFVLYFNQLGPNYFRAVSFDQALIVAEQTHGVIENNHGDLVADYSTEVN